MTHSSFLDTLSLFNAIICLYTQYQPHSAPPLKLEKIWFFGVKLWFFTRNTPKIFALPSALRKFFKCAPPPNLKSWIRPCSLTCSHTYMKLCGYINFCRSLDHLINKPIPKYNVTTIRVHMKIYLLQSSKTINQYLTLTQTSTSKVPVTFSFHQHSVIE